MKIASLVLALTASAAPVEPLPTNPAVTQATIGETICRTGWTRTIRPPHGPMRRLKRRMLAEIGEPASHARRYELDHAIPLTLWRRSDRRAQSHARARRRGATEKRRRILPLIRRLPGPHDAGRCPARDLDRLARRRGALLGRSPMSRVNARIVEIEIKEEAE
jgi:hypothetical protein